MHDTHPFAAAALPELIATVKESGLRFSTLGDWLI
jgi:hypothetical protein